MMKEFVRSIKSTFSTALFFGLFLGCLNQVNAQSIDKVYEKVDVYPEYPGGKEGLMKFMIKNLKYPKKARKAGVEGKVIVRFNVEKDGSISDAKILKGISESCNSEALRIVNKMEKWSPGEVKGEVVITQLHLPIKFSI